MAHGFYCALQEEVANLTAERRAGVERLHADVTADLEQRRGGQDGAGAPSSDERPNTRTERQEKANLLREAKRKLVLKCLDDEPALRDLDYRGLSAALKPKGLSVNPTFLSRNLRNTKYDRGRARGNPHRPAKGKGEREAVAADDPADLSEMDAWTMPEDHT